MKRKLAILCSALVGLCFTAGCTQQDTANQLTPVRLNEVVHSVFYAPQYVAQEMGFFEEEGLDVTVSVGNGADKSMTALLSDSADIALLGTEAGIYVYNEGKLSQSISAVNPASRKFLGFSHRRTRFPMDRSTGKIRHWRSTGRHAGIGTGIYTSTKRHGTFH